MTIIALQGVRGGVGATAVTAGLAWALQAIGESVLVIDLSFDNIIRLHFNMPFVETTGWARAVIDGTSWHKSALRYMPLLDFLPFGTLSKRELTTIEASAQNNPNFLKDKLLQLTRTNYYRFILLDLPSYNTVLARSGLALSDTIFSILYPDANTQLRLHQQAFRSGTHFLINQYSPHYPLQHDLHVLWQKTLPNLIPVTLHHDEAMAESLANKQPVGEYAPESLAAEEILTFANWCLISLNNKNLTSKKVVQ